MIGETLTHYRIVERIGEGGMGVVYRAHDERLDRDVAVKVLPAGALADDAARARFRREALALSRLSHPRIAHIFDFDTERGQDFLVMEYVPGVTLDAQLRAGPMPWLEAVAVARQIAEALEEAHERGVVHRDLKPGNVVVSAKGWVKVLDFGLAKLLDPGDAAKSMASVTASQTVVGTLPYMAPEILVGAAADARSDLYALAVVLYEMLTGRRPFVGTTPGGLIDAILHRSPVPPADLVAGLPAELERLVLRDLERDPGRRHHAAGEVVAELKHLGGEARGSAAPARSARGRRRLRVLAISLAVGVVALLGLRFGAPLVGGLLPHDRIDSIAVLPLENLSRDSEQDYFADGMTDALITQLAQIADLRVISRTSIMRYRENRPPLSEIARALHVKGVVEGTVLRSGDRVRITANLIDAVHDTHLWSETFERGVHDVLALQSDVAGSITDRIRARLTPLERARLEGAAPVDPAAYEAYLRGRYLWSRRTRDGLEASIPYFQRAIEIAPRYAAAHAGLADTYALMDLYAGCPPRDCLVRAREAALHALSLDDRLAEAHASLARVKLFYDWDWNGAAGEFRRAIELNPNYATARHWHSIYLRDVGRFDEAIEESRAAVAIDPLSVIINVNLGDTYFYARRFELAMAQLRQTLALDSSFAATHLYLGKVYAEAGKLPEAISELERARGLSRDSTYAAGELGYAAARAGNRARGADSGGAGAALAPRSGRRGGPGAYPRRPGQERRGGPVAWKGVRRAGGAERPRGGSALRRPQGRPAFRRPAPADGAGSGPCAGDRRTGSEPHVVPHPEAHKPNPVAGEPGGPSGTGEVEISHRDVESDPRSQVVFEADPRHSAEPKARSDRLGAAARADA